MDKKRTRELARIEWQKEKEAKRRARNLGRKSPEQPETSEPAQPEKAVKEASREACRSRGGLAPRGAEGSASTA